MHEKNEDSDIKKYVWNNEEPQPIAIPLPNHHSQHNADADQQDHNFVGRDHLLQDIVAVLEETKNSRGCYLIAGFRGAGKTSLINKALAIHAGRHNHPSWLNIAAKFGADISIEDLRVILRRANKKLRPHDNKINLPKKPKPAKNLLVKVDVNLGNDQRLEPRVVLLNTASLLYSSLKRNSQQWPLRLARWSVVLSSWLVVTAISCIAIHSIQPVTNNPSENYWTHEWSRWLAELFNLSNIHTVTSPAIILPLLISVLFWYIWTRYLPTHENIILSLKKLKNRMENTEEHDRGVSSSGFSFNRKMTTPPLNSRQIESELLNILEDARKVRPKFLRPDIVFVFDELDKITTGTESIEDENNSSPSPTKDLYERKNRVDNLLSALKSFISHGRARFFS